VYIKAPHIERRTSRSVIRRPKKEECGALPTDAMIFYHRHVCVCCGCQKVISTHKICLAKQRQRARLNLNNFPVCMPASAASQQGKKSNLSYDYCQLEPTLARCHHSCSHVHLINFSVHIGRRLLFLRRPLHKSLRNNRYTRKHAARFPLRDSCDNECWLTTTIAILFLWFHRNSQPTAVSSQFASLNSSSSQSTHRAVAHTCERERLNIFHHHHLAMKFIPRKKKRF
jgi:hypothetical protein